MSWTKVVAITGCDSGLGWAIAARTAREGLVTVAGTFYIFKMYKYNIS